jgi:plasmid stability protein
MATLNIKSVPEVLVERLKERATLHKRSLNLEVIACLEAVVRAVPIDAESRLAQVRAVRQELGGMRLTDRSLARPRTAGRL